MFRSNDEKSKRNTYDTLCNDTHQCIYCKSKTWNSFDTKDHSQAHIDEREWDTNCLSHNCTYCTTVNNRQKKYDIETHHKDCNLLIWEQDCKGNHGNCGYCNRNKMDYTKSGHREWHRDEQLTRKKLKSYQEDIQEWGELTGVDMR